MNFPTLGDALKLQRALIDEFGGAHGMINRSLLESALGRPQTDYYDGLYLKAAALMESLILNHPFVDGNKRTGLALTATFLQMNSYRLIISADAGEKFVTEDIVVKRVGLKGIATWIKRHTEKC